MVIINEEDIGKPREQVLLELIYEATGQIIPLDKIKFGKPRVVDQRRDLEFDPNTFIPVKIDVQFDARYDADGSGFMYRRRELADHSAGGDFSGVKPTVLPFKVSDVLEQINAALPYPISAEDIVDHEYTTLEQVQEGIRVDCHPESLLWVGSITVTADTSFLTGDVLVENLMLAGFNEVTLPETIPAY